MRGSLILIVAIGALWVVDVMAFDSRYSGSVWQATKQQGQQLNYEVRRWLSRANF
jgi:hypothetical protein